MSESENFQSLTDRKRIEHARKLDELDCPRERVNLKRVMQKWYKDRTEEELRTLHEFVGSVKFFRQALQNGTISKQTIEELCKGVEMRVFEKNQVVFRQGSVGDAFYLVIEGNMHVLVKPHHSSETEEDAALTTGEGGDKPGAKDKKPAVDSAAETTEPSTNDEGDERKVGKHGEKDFEARKRAWLRRRSQVNVEEDIRSLAGHIRVAIIQDGGSFGDLALLNNDVRSASIVGKASKNYLLVIRREVYDHAILKLQREIMNKRLKFLRRIHAFDGWNKESLQSIANLLQEGHYIAGDVIAKEGDLAEDFILIKRGEARVLKRLKIKDMHFYAEHMERANAPHLSHSHHNHDDGSGDAHHSHELHHKDNSAANKAHHKLHTGKNKKRLKKYCFVDVGTLKKYGMFGHVALLPKAKHVRDFHIKTLEVNEDYTPSEQPTSPSSKKGVTDSAHHTGDVHAHHHERSLVASSQMTVYKLSRHDFGRRMHMFLQTLAPFIEYERTEDEISAQHLETEEWELFKSALIDDTLRNSARSRRLARHDFYVGKHFQPPPPRKLPVPPRVIRGHYHDPLLEYLEKRRAIRLDFISGKSRKEAIEKIGPSPLARRAKRGKLGHSTKVGCTMALDDHINSRDGYWSAQKLKPQKVGDIHHHDPSAAAWELGLWDQPNPPTDVRYRRLMKTYERRRFKEHSINRLRKVAIHAKHSDWIVGNPVANRRRKGAPLFKAAAKSMRKIIISTFQKNRNAVSDSFRSV